MAKAPSTLTLRLRAIALLGVLALIMYLCGWLLLNPSNLVNQAFRGPITRIDTHLLAGPYPTDRDLSELRAQGVRTVVSLLDARVPYEDQLLARERAATSRQGMHLVNIPMTSFFGHGIGDDYATAASTAANAVRQAPDSVYLHGYVGDRRLNTVLTLLARDHPVAAATSDPSDVPARTARTADTLAEGVAKRYDAHDFTGALELYAAIARPEPRTRLLAAWADFRLNRIDAAETLFREVRDLDPALWDAASGLAYCALRRNELTAAEGGFQSVLEQHPGDIQALIGLAVTYAHAGRYERAKATLEEVLAKHPDNREAHDLLITYQARIASASRR